MLKIFKIGQAGHLCRLSSGIWIRHQKGCTAESGAIAGRLTFPRQNYLEEVRGNMHQVREATNCAYVQYTAMTGAGRKVRGARDNDHILYIRVGVRQHSHQSMSVRREVRASPDMHLTSLSWSKRAAHDSSTRHTPLFTPRTWLVHAHCVNNNSQPGECHARKLYLWTDVGHGERVLVHLLCFCKVCCRHHVSWNDTKLCIKKWWRIYMYCGL